MLKVVSSLILFILIQSGANAQVNYDQQIKDLLAKMTLEEKVGQMTQVTFDVIDVYEKKNTDGRYPIDMDSLRNAVVNYKVGSILNTPYNKAQSVETWNRIITDIQNMAKETRLGIPVIYGIDAIHGPTYTRGGTLFPQALALASSFNVEHARTMGEVTAKEVRATGMTWNFYPVLDIGRQPAWSRTWETYGEDVHLARAMGAAYIEGHQGDDYGAKHKAATCLKHYLGYSFPINGKDRTPAWISERMIREYFLPPFEAGLDAGSPTVMINSGEVDGIPGHANYHYLTEILRKELKFDGLVVSDWEDIKNLYKRDKVAASPEEAVKMSVMAGVDMSMVPKDFSFFEILVKLVNEGQVPMSRIDEAVYRILKVKFESGLFDDPYPQKQLVAEFASKESEMKNLQAARESVVLAKNENQFLPFKKEAKLLVTGPTANLLNVLNGGWTVTWQGNDESLYPQEKNTVLEALQAKSKGTITFIEGAGFDKLKDVEKAKQLAKNHDAIVLCLGEPAYCETPGNINDLWLPFAQIELAKAMIETGKPVLLLLLEGRPRIATPAIHGASAVLIGFLPGMEGGNAIADIIYGDYNPDGKMPISYPVGPNSYTPYDYKPLEDYDRNEPGILFPFGHGLSYTSFETSNLKLNQTTIREGEGLTVTVDVKNTGKVPGKESVLVYLNDNAAQVSRPNKQLKAFQKVDLKPGESKNLTFKLTDYDFSFIGLENKRITEAGTFTIMVGKEKVNFVLEKN